MVSDRYTMFFLSLLCTHLLSASTLPQTSKLAVMRKAALLATVSKQVEVENTSRDAKNKLLEVNERAEVEDTSGNAKNELASGTGKQVQSAWESGFEYFANWFHTERTSHARNTAETQGETTDGPASIANRERMMRVEDGPPFSMTSLVGDRQQDLERRLPNRDIGTVSQHYEGREVTGDPKKDIMLTLLPDQDCPDCHRSANRSVQVSNSGAFIMPTGNETVTEWRPSRKAGSCCEHRRRREINVNACSNAKAPENWWCEEDFKHAGVCGCFGGFGTANRAECAWCGKNVLQGDLANAQCDFVGVRMRMTSCKKDASSIRETAQWFSGWDHYALCEHGHIATGNATCEHSGGDRFSGYHQRWFSTDCNTVYIFFFDGSSQKSYAFSILTHLGATWRFKHEHWLHDTYIECDAMSV